MACIRNRLDHSGTARDLRRVHNSDHIREGAVWGKLASTFPARINVCSPRVHTEQLPHVRPAPVPLLTVLLAFRIC